MVFIGASVLKSNPTLHTLQGHTGTISSISVNVDESLIASASLTGDILIHPKGQKHQSYSALIVPTEKVYSLFPIS